MATIHRPVSANVVRPIGAVTNVTKTGRIATQSATASGQYGHFNLTQATMGDVGNNDFLEASTRFVSISGVAGDLTLVPLVPSRQIEVDGYNISCTASGVSTTVRFRSSGNFLSGPMQIPKDGYISHQDASVMRTNVGEPLVINNSVGTIGGHLTYRIL